MRNSLRHGRDPRTGAVALTSLVATEPAAQARRGPVDAAPTRSTHATHLPDVVIVIPVRDAAESVPAHPWSIPATEVTRALAVDPADGLGGGEASVRRGRVGPNDLPREPPPSLAHSVLAQLRQTMITPGA